MLKLAYSELFCKFNIFQLYIIYVDKAQNKNLGGVIMSISKKNRIKDLISLWIYGLCCIILIWVALSTIEVWYHNALLWKGEAYEYNILNFWDIMLNYFWR